MIRNFKSVNRRLIINVLLGFGLISIPFLTSPDLHSGFEMLRIPPFQRDFLSYFLLLVFFYINFYVIVPLFYFPKKWIVFAILVTTSYLTVLKLPNLIITETPHKFFESMNMPPPPSGKHNEMLSHPIFSRDSYFFQFIIVFMLSLFLRIDERLQQLKNEQLLTEVSYLKAQINPHFLFNTLNSLYALTLTKSNEAPNAILKLSDLMRYVVTESNKKKVSLQKEVNYIKNFISLQELRLTDNIHLTTHFIGDFSTYKIVPLLLINFIENSFKYGVNTEETSKININLKIDGEKWLHLNVENTIVALDTSITSTKKGLENTKKRLEFWYPAKYQLHQTIEKNIYKVQLKLQLE